MSSSLSDDCMNWHPEVPLHVANAFTRFHSLDSPLFIYLATAVDASTSVTTLSQHHWFEAHPCLNTITPSPFSSLSISLSLFAAKKDRRKCPGDS